MINLLQQDHENSSASESSLESSSGYGSQTMPLHGGHEDHPHPDGKLLVLQPSACFVYLSFRSFGFLCLFLFILSWHHQFKWMIWLICYHCLHHP